MNEQACVNFTALCKTTEEGRNLGLYNVSTEGRIQGLILKPN